MKTSDMLDALKAYSGPAIRIMEVCGTHTAAIARSGMRSLLPESITLLSGPGCPVCVTPDGFIDRLRRHALELGDTVLSFGDMLRVPGAHGSLSHAKSLGGDIRMVYSPFEALALARENPDKSFVLAAVGFETIAPAYALLVQQAQAAGVANLKLLTSIKTMPAVLKLMCRQDIHGFLAPGHVAAICGADAFAPLARKYSKPFCVAGFTDEAVIAAIYDLTLQITCKTARVHNLYTSVVSPCGNAKALAVMEQVFEPCDAAWRGLGTVQNSGLRLRERYRSFDAGDIDEEERADSACRCGDVICGRILPDKCPLFKTVCTPDTPKGPCMVSQEGACGVWYNTI